MKIFSNKGIKEWDAYTIQHEPISSGDLMERAARACFDWIHNSYPFNSQNLHIKIFCGNGNNGGDGMALGRILSQAGYFCEVYHVASETGNQSEDLIQNEKRLQKETKLQVKNINQKEDIPVFTKNDLVIDALFGAGLNKPIEGIIEDLVYRINEAKKEGIKIISIDIPTGLYSDQCSTGNKFVIQADHTLTFQVPKLSFMFPENAAYLGNWHVLNIGLSRDFEKITQTKHIFITREVVQSIFHVRTKFSHKGNFGHALIIAGSQGKIGASILASRACLRTGAGLVTALIPECGYTALQTAIPEAMTIIGGKNHIADFIDYKELIRSNAIGIGPGIGRHSDTEKALKNFIQHAHVPLVLDADAINILSENKTWLSFLPKETILTPHPKEFERIAGKSSDNFERLEMQLQFSIKYHCYLVLKGAHTSVTCPDGTIFFNSTGNPGMAKGGSGDALTGIITGLMAQGYNSKESCIMGTYIHGLAGDMAVQTFGEQGLLATDIIENIGPAFKSLFPLEESQPLQN